MTIEQWQDDNSRCLGMLIDGRAQATGIKRRGSDVTLLLIYNASHEDLEFVLPAVADGRSWIAVVDTNAPEQETREYPFEHSFLMTSRSFAMLVLSTAIRSTGLRQGLDAILNVIETPLAS
jgi:glycogen operon protein